MKIIIKACVILAVFILIAAGGIKKNPQWKGTIEEENGVKVIKNPNEPLYGELTLELEEDLVIGNEDDENYFFYRGIDVAIDRQDNILILDTGNCRIQKFDKNGNYLQTIGRMGQGPGEFESPGKIFIDSQDKIFINDKSRRIVVFRNKGEYLKTISLDCSISDFYVSPSENLFAISSITDEKGIKLEVVEIDSEGKVIKIFADFRGLEVVKRKSGDVKGFFLGPHEYKHKLCFSSADERAFCYAYASEYRLFLIDNDGNLFLIIQKEENPQSISQKEKEFILNRARKKIGTRWPKGALEEAYKFPSFRPFFDFIIADDKLRIYIKRMMSVLRDEGNDVDIFSKDGQYLYKTNISVVPHIIKHGFLYNIDIDEDTGNIKLKRFKIKNWDQIKTGIN